MSSLLGVAAALRDLLPHTFGIDPSPEDRDIAKRMMCMARNLVAGGEEDDMGPQCEVVLEEVDSYDPCDDADDRRSSRFADWSAEKRQKVVDAYDSIAPKRTLSNVGEKDTEVAVQNKDKTTHSYSIQVAMSAAGELVGPVHLMLQETTKNVFGPRVQQDVDKVMAAVPSGLVKVNCSGSGYFSKETYADYIEMLMALMGTDTPTLLLKDAWSGQSGKFAEEMFRTYPNLLHRTFPPGSTSFLQPQDLVLFHAWKMFWREIIKHVRLLKIPVSFSDRLNIIVLHSQIRDQLGSAIFRDLMVYGYSRPGIVDADEDAPYFEQPKDVWFPPSLSSSVCFESTQEKQCKSVRFLQLLPTSSLFRTLLWS